MAAVVPPAPMMAFQHSFGPGQFRVILAILVVLSHMSDIEIGRPAVFVFFMLSGYWVLRMYEEKYCPAASLGVFYLSRFMRIWLAFATAFLAAFLLLALTPLAKPAEMLWGLPLLGIATTKRDVLGTSWSLDIEMQFYLLVPVISLVLVWMGQSCARLIVLATGIACLTILGWWLQLSLGLWTLMSYLPPFMIGALIYHWRLRGTVRSAAMGVAAFLAVGAIVAMIPYLRPLLSREIDGPFHEDWFGMAWVTLLVPFVIWNLEQKSGPLDMHLGNYSYALYITHWPIIAVMRAALRPVTFAEALLILVVIAVVSVAFYLTVDRGWESVRRKFISRLSSTARISV